jgi:hypothetical protein
MTTEGLFMQKKDRTLCASVTDNKHDFFVACAEAEGTDKSGLLNELIDKYLNAQLVRFKVLAPVIERQINNK